MDLHPDFRDLLAELGRAGVSASGRAQDLADVELLERVRSARR